MHEALATTDVMHCVPSPALQPLGAADPRPNAYFVMVGPFTRARKYKKWLYAVLALANALKKHGSSADVVVLCAMKADARDSTHATAEEEDLLSRHGVNWRYVHAPYGNSGFHMGHYKLWAWQHTEYAKIQLLDLPGIIEGAAYGAAYGVDALLLCASLTFLAICALLVPAVGRGVQCRQGAVGRAAEGHGEAR